MYFAMIIAKELVENLVEWSSRNYAHLPWRHQRTLYTTLVSEIMLQQTTVKTVLGHFSRFIQEYPDVFAVANATEEQLTISWKGLGYYRRARNLKKACESFASNYDGKIPLDRELLLKIPGIGDYTAHALLAIGANKSYLAVDANLERVLSRLYAVETPKGPQLNKALYKLFNEQNISQEINHVGGRAYNEALMDLGRNYCSIRNPDCALCPLSETCQSFQKKLVHKIPNVINVKKNQSLDLELLRIVVIKDNSVMAYQKSKDEWLSGQWELPTYILSSEDRNLKQYPYCELAEDIFMLLPSFKTLITKYKINNKLLILSEQEMRELKLPVKDVKWIPMCDKTQNLTTASLKALKQLELMR